MSKNKSKQLTPFQPRNIQQTASASIEQFSGPLPHPTILKQYDEVLPGGAERIVAMAERQSAHRQQLEKMVVESNCRNERSGTILGFVICMTTIGGGFYLILRGMDSGGIAAIVSSLAGLIFAFVYGKKKQAEERSQKLEQFKRT
jgi:uncharacterized membrane protein